MKFSIIIPAYNRTGTLRQTLTAATDQDFSQYEVIVVDDGSSDGTPEMVEHEFPSVQLLRQPNRGPAAARNRGIEAATGDIIAFTDDDCLPPNDWLARLADGYARYPQVAGVGGGLKAPPDILASNVYAQYERYVAQQVYHVGEAEVVAGFDCPAGGTANMSYRKSVLVDVEGFDTQFPVAASEDADLKLRICQRGHTLLYIPVRVIHLQDYTWERFRRQCYVRGIGRNYFEQLHGAGYPGRAKIALRVVRRLLAFPFDLWRTPTAKLAWVKLADGLITCQGQWGGR